MFEDLVKQKEIELRNHNLEELRKELSSPNLIYKIQNYANKYSFSVEEIKARIKVDDLVASFFIKDPYKQNFVETLVGKILRAEVLPQSGKRCIRFDENGYVCSTKKPGCSKAADFCINNTYITQKYTRSAGGAQDNQYIDVIDFLNKGSRRNKVAAIVDGSYWNTGKREELREYFQTNNNV